MAKTTFTPVQHYKTDKKGNLVLDDKGCKIALDLYKGTTFEEMFDFIKENGTTEQKQDFITACHTKKVYEVVIGKKGGKKKIATGETTVCEEVNVLYAKEWFFKQFAPEYLPVKKEKEEKPSMEDMLKSLL